MAQMWRRMYPVNRCRNFGGRGHARSTFINHLKTHRHIFLTNDIERTRVLQSTTKFGDLRCCGLCGRQSASAFGRSFWRVCTKETREFTLSQSEHTLLTSKKSDANKTELRILSEIQPLLRRHWSKYVSTTLAFFFSAHSETESWKALEAWTKLKSVLLLPRKGGTKRRQSTYKFYAKRMLL